MGNNYRIGKKIYTTIGFFLDMAEVEVVDFTEMSFEDKKKLVLKNLWKAYNYEDITATTLDWSSSSPGLTVPSQMVLTVLQSLDFHRICSELVGKKRWKEFY